MSVATQHGAWVVPPQRAVWVPAAVEHSINVSGRLHVRTLYLRPDLAPKLPGTCSVLHVSPLLRELIIHIVENGPLDEEEPLHAHLAQVLVALLVDQTEMAVDLRLPTDPRARFVANHVLRDLAQSTPLPVLARAGGASTRTIERLFSRETGVSFGHWRQQARLLEALRLLASDASVADVAHNVGYETCSAFIVMFKRALGVTPGRYFRKGP